MKNVYWPNPANSIRVFDHIGLMRPIKPKRLQIGRNIIRLLGRLDYVM